MADQLTMGYLFVEGRIDDIIIRGGENISPGEIEEVLLDHPISEMLLRLVFLMRNGGKLSLLL